MTTTSTPPPVLNVLLTALFPRPECCVDTEEYGTFVLQGIRLSNGDVQLVVESLSTLQYNKKSSKHTTSIVSHKHAQVDTVEWTRVALWSSSSTLSRIPVAQTMKGIPHLKQRLQDALDKEEGMRTKKTELDPLHAFLKSGHAVFGELLDALATVKREQHNRLLPASHHGWTSTHLLELHDQLEALESNYFPHSIELSPDLSKVTLQALDEGKRVHTMVLDLTNFRSTNHDITIQQWQVPERDDVLIRTKKRFRRTKSEIDPENGPPTVSEFFDDLEDIVENCQELWNQLDDLDANTWVLLQDATNKNRASCQRRICLRAPQQDRQQRIDDDTEGESNMEQPTTIVLSLHPGCARQRPENIHILGGSLGSRTGRKSEFDEYEWDDRLMVRENLENCFGPGSLAKPKEDDDTSVSSADKKNYICPTIDCGICFLECTTVTGTAASSPCENPKCARPYHTACLYKWLSTKPTSRTSFDYVLGECPYCNDPIAVQQPEEDEDYV